MPCVVRVSRPSRAFGVLVLAVGLAAGTVACRAEPEAGGPPAPSPTPSAQPSPSARPSQSASTALSPVALTTARGADPGAAAGRSLNLRSGWTAQVWANVPGARMAAWTPDGRLVVSTGDGGSLVLLTPRSGGQSPSVSTLVRGLENPQGIALTTVDGRDAMVVGAGSRLLAWEYAHGAVSHQRTILAGLPATGHGSKMVAVRDGRVYYNVGSATNRDPIDRTSKPQRATIASVGLDGSGNRTLAVGVRNGEGLSFAPDGTLYAAVNQADNQPYPFRDSTGKYGKTVQAYVNEHPNDQISPITPGTDMGWPYCVPDSRGHDDLTDLGYVNDPSSNSGGKALDCSRIGRTQVGLPAHSAPVGFVFTPGSALPDALAHGALVTAHGSWNRKPPREPYVAYSAWNGATKTLGAATPIVTGFQNPDGSRWGRCVDAVPGPDGSLYVTDDAAGLVYRLTPPR